MFILFISDVHLCNKNPHAIDCFFQFLYYRAIHAQALYILGDLFEIWIGDDDPNPLHVRVSYALKYLQKHHTACYFQHGNHDFLLGKEYAINCGMILLPSQKIINFFGYRILLLHGDTLYVNDNLYKIFRKYSRIIWIKNLFLLLPISIRLYISYMINNIKKNKSNKIIKNINQEKIEKILFQTNTEIMIHGHIHQANTYYKIINNTRKLERISLGSWGKKGSILEINEKGIFLKEFSI